jgi:hypothetical protein
MGVTEPRTSPESAVLLDRIDEHEELLEHLIAVAAVHVANPASFAAAVDATLDNVDALRALLGRIPTIDAAAPVTATVSETLSTSHYEEQITEVHAAIGRCVPHGGNVAVISRGDGRLVEFAAHHGRHFPAHDDGSWIGYHPRHGADAVAHLDAAPRAGVTYLAIPAPMLWWLSFYPELRRELERRGEMVHSSEHCLIYLLAQPGLESTSIEAGQQLRLDQLGDLLDAVLPAGCPILIASGGERSFADVRARVVVHFPGDVSGAYAGEPWDVPDALAQLHRMRQTGIQYLVVPFGGGLCTRAMDGFRTYLRERFVVVVDRPTTALVLDLTRRGAAGARDLRNPTRKHP